MCARARARACVRACACERACACICALTESASKSYSSARPRPRGTTPATAQHDTASLQPSIAERHCGTTVRRCFAARLLYAQHVGGTLLRRVGSSARRVCAVLRGGEVRADDRCQLVRYESVLWRQWTRVRGSVRAWVRLATLQPIERWWASGCAVVHRASTAAHGANGQDVHGAFD